MFEKILIANRGDQPPAGGAAAQRRSQIAQRLKAANAISPRRQHNV